MGNQVRPELLRLYKFGMVMFALQALYMSVALYYAYLLEIQFIAVVGSEQYVSIDWAKLFFFPIFILVPILLIFVTYNKLYVPEKNLKASNNKKSWSLLLALLGFPFGLIIGGALFAQAYSKIKSSERNK